MTESVVRTPHLRKTGVLVGLAALVVIGFATLLPTAPGPAAPHLCVICGSFGTVDAILNLGLFVPLGVGLALSGVGAKRAIIGMFLLSGFIELAQLVIPGRDSTIGDVLTNTLGGALGFALARSAYSWLDPSPAMARTLSATWSILWLAIQTVSAFGFSPVLPHSQYYGEIAPMLGGFDQFRGRVLRAMVSDVTVPPTRFEDSRGVRELLEGGATTAVMIVTGGKTRAVAPIVRIADDHQREIMIFAQKDDMLVYGLRGGAAVLRLRPPFFAMRGVFDSAGTSGTVRSDSLTASGRYTPHEVGLDAKGAKETLKRRIPIVASLGWTMVSPVRWYLEGSLAEGVITIVWTSLLLFPLGYWIASVGRTGRHRRPASWLTLAFAIIAVLSTGFVGVPHIFDVGAATLGDWLAGVGGIVLGATLGSRVIGRNRKIQS